MINTHIRISADDARSREASNDMCSQPGKRTGGQFAS